MGLLPKIAAVRRIWCQVAILSRESTNQRRPPRTARKNGTGSCRTLVKGLSPKYSVVGLFLRVFTLLQRKCC